MTRAIKDQALILSTSLTLLAALASGCSQSDAQPFSPRNDATDSPTQDDQDGAESARLRGDVDAATATDVRAVTYDEEGRYIQIGSGRIELDGSFDLSVDTEVEDVVIDAMDAEGRILASTLIEITPADGESSDVGTLDDETTVEAEVLLALRADAEASGLVDIEDVEARISAELAAAAMDSDDSAELVLDLALVLDGAAEVASQAWAEASGELRMDGEARSEASIAAEVTAQTEATVRALAASSMEDSETMAALTLESLQAEGRATASATAELAAESGGNMQATIDIAAQVLVSTLDEAEDAEDAEAAFEAFADAVVSASIGDGGETSGGLFGQITASLDALIGDLDTWGEDMRSELKIVIEASVEDGILDGDERDEMAEAIIDARAAFEAEVEAMVSEMAEDGSGASDLALAAELLIQAKGHVDTDSDE